MREGDTLTLISGETKRTFALVKARARDVEFSEQGERYRLCIARGTLSQVRRMPDVRIRVLGCRAGWCSLDIEAPRAITIENSK